MAEVMDLRGEQVTLGWFNFKIGLPKLLEQAIQAGQMILKSNFICIIDNNIIQVNQTSSPLQVCEDQVLWKVLGALQRPKLRTLNSNSPWRVMKAVLWRSLGSTSTCQ